MSNEQQLHDESYDVSGWLFMIDYPIVTLSVIVNTVLAIIWIKYGYFSRKRPSFEETHSKSASSNDSNDVNKKITKQMMKQTAHNIPYLGRLYMTLSILFAVLFSYYFFIFCTVRKTNDLRKHKFICMHTTLIMIPYGLNRVFLYLYFIWRLDVSFASSLLEIAKKKVKLLSIAVIVTFLCSTTFYIIHLNMVQCKDSFNYTLAGSPFVLFDSIWAWLLLYLFLSRLRKLLKMDENNDRQNTLKKFQYIANKLTILALVAILSTSFMLLIYFFMPFFSLTSIDTSLNVICLMLSCVNYDGQYKKLCSLCRMCCEKEMELKKPDQIANKSDSSMSSNNVEMVMN